MKLSFGEKFGLAGILLFVSFIGLAVAGWVMNIIAIFQTANDPI